MIKLVVSVTLSMLLFSSGTNKPVEASRPARENGSRQETKQLVQSNEEIIYAFTTKNKKEVVVVKDTSNNYIKYRYGRARRRVAHRRTAAGDRGRQERLSPRAGRRSRRAGASASGIRSAVTVKAHGYPVAPASTPKPAAPTPIPPS